MTATRLETARTTLKLAEDAHRRAERRLEDARTLLAEEERRAGQHGDVPMARAGRRYRIIWSSSIP